VKEAVLEDNVHLARREWEWDPWDVVVPLAVEVGRRGGRALVEGCGGWVVRVGAGKVELPYCRVGRWWEVGFRAVDFENNVVVGIAVVPGAVNDTLLMLGDAVGQLVAVGDEANLSVSVRADLVVLDESTQEDGGCEFAVGIGSQPRWRVTKGAVGACPLRTVSRANQP